MELFPFTFERCGNYDHPDIAELKFFPDGAEQATFGPVAWELQFNIWKVSGCYPWLTTISESERQNP